MKKKTTITTETREICVISAVGEGKLALLRNDSNDVPLAEEITEILPEELVPQKQKAKGLDTLLRILRATYRQ